MTTMHEEIKTCMHCGKKNKYKIIDSTIALGPSDLDTRPAPMERDTIEYRIQRCHYCNYTSDNIEEKVEFDDSILNSDYYLKTINSKYPLLAKNYILASIIKESINEYDSAAVFMLNACWVLDDFNIDSKKERIVAAKLFEKVEGIQEARMITIDLYRRAKEFEKAKLLINESKDFITDTYMKKILLCQKTLVDKRDSKCHNCSKIDEYIDEESLIENDILEDTMEEIQRKLFEENCKELIYRNIHGNRVAFEQIAIIPIKENKEKSIYVLLHPINQDIMDDEALVFKLLGRDKLEELELITDSDIIDKVFDEYYRLFEESHK